MIATLVKYAFFTITLGCILAPGKVLSQEQCVVKVKLLMGQYDGECRDGLANGQGEAIGAHRYVGIFKNGKPDGKGTYYYNDSTYYEGLFLNGLREGKGEMHSGPDSTITGFWSGDEYRGKRYITYKFTGNTRFESYSIIPSKRAGNTITFEMSSSSGSPNGAPVNFRGGRGYVLRLRSLISTNGIFINKLRELENGFRVTETYEISDFPVVLFGTLSNGEYFELELYRPANWKVKFYLNR